jgi:hypothetical protein
MRQKFCADSEGQLHQIVRDVGRVLQVTPEPAEAYLRQLQNVKASALPLSRFQVLVNVSRDVSVSNLAQHVRRIRLRHSTGRSYDSHKCTGQQCRRREADRERIVRTYPRKQGGG